jgi:hypothetical protein
MPYLPVGIIQDLLSLSNLQVVLHIAMHFSAPQSQHKHDIFHKLTIIFIYLFFMINNARGHNKPFYISTLDWINKSFPVY